jgi:hypothetical protein
MAENDFKNSGGRVHWLKLSNSVKNIQLVQNSKNLSVLGW